jgi:oligosaccharide repeat unit polymerase
LDQLANFIAIACVVHFLWSYYWNCYRKGYSMDIWHFSLFNSLLVIHVMMPFARSDLNVFAVGPVLLRRVQSHVTQSYLISAFGYVAVLIGGNFWRLNLGLGFRSGFSRVIELPARGSLLLLRSKSLLVLNGVISLTLLLGVVLYYFTRFGFGLNMSSILIVTPSLRPIAQFSAFYSVLISSYCIVRFYVYKEKILLPIIILSILGLIFFGERSNIANIFMLVILGMFIRRGRRLKLIWLIGGLFAAISLALFMDAFRRPNFSLTTVMASFALSLFYGNSFSDTRDFALVLSFWDGQYLLGKTYLAAIIAFIPRSLSTFRDTWSYGVVTATMAGYKPTEHPGLRIGRFGEAYLNFGLVGVALLGIFVGIVIRLVDMRMKQSARIFPESDIRLFSYYLIITMAFVVENSTGASTCYTIMLIIFASWSIQRICRFLQIPL